MKRELKVLALLFFVPLAAHSQSRPGLTRVSISQSTLPAAGRHTSLMTVSAFGRFSVSTSSKQGVAVQLVNKMSGPGPVHGQAGAEDGRLDLLLDRGTYQIVTYGDERASGKVALTAKAFDELNTKPQRLIEYKLVSERLGDYEQRSYWVEIPTTRWVTFEAAGRHLADLRLWKDGAWLVDAAPHVDTINPKVGQPLTHTVLTAQLNPGWYLLTAYGGPGQPWADESDSQPFLLRYGIPELPAAGRQRFTVGPFGFDRYRVGGEANYVRLELEEPRPARVSAWGYNVSNPIVGRSGTEGVIDKKSVPPVAEIYPASMGPSGQHVVTVKAEEGQSYVLQHFQRQRYYSLGRMSGDYWISSVHSGHLTDSIDATALVVEHTGEPGPITPMATDLIVLDKPWSTRSNLLGEVSLFFRLPASRTVEIESTGTDAEFQIEPYMLTRPPHYEPPEFRKAGKWKLDAGYYVLRIRPKKQGIAEVTLRPTGAVRDAIRKLGGKRKPGDDVHASVKFPNLRLSGSRGYTVYLNEQGSEVESGLIVRRLPMDLARALPLTQQDGEEIAIPFLVNEPGTLAATTENGERMELQVDNGSWSEIVSVSGGRHTVRIRNTSGRSVAYSLQLTPPRLKPTSPLPRMPDAAIAGLPKLDVLTEQAPQYLDLNRNAHHSFLVKADRPALYQLQSTGLLATSGNLRTRTVTSFVRQQSNGVGRNFLVQQYLREGDYQLTVQTLGRSTGHLGVKLARTRVLDGGELIDRVPARISVPAGDAVRYTIRVAEAGRYRIEGFGVGRVFRSRLEDADGWPLRQPNTPADFTVDLEPGLYQLLLLPEAVESRRVTVLTHERAEPVREGHGPHELILGRAASHTWEEPESGDRVPDVWEFHVPATIEARIQLTSEMQAELMRGQTRVDYVPPVRGWTGTLEPGTYRLHATCVRKNNYQDYTVSVTPTELTAGITRSIYAPARVPVAVGTRGLVELSSLGRSDVRARLYDAEGRLVTTGDDRENDWNFQLATRLAPGTYALQVDPVGTSHAQVEISMFVPGEQIQKTLALPARQTIQTGGDAFVYPLEPGSRADLLVAGATSRESVGLTIEARDGDQWVALGTATGARAHLEVPITPGEASYRLRVWSADRRGNPITVSVASISARRFSESRLTRGTKLRAVRGVDPPIAAAFVELDAPGLLDIDGTDVRWCPAPGLSCASVGERLVSAERSGVWLVAPVDERVALRRESLRPGGKPATVRLAPGRRAIADLSTSKPIRVLIASSMVAQPAVSLSARGPQDTQMAVAERAALAFVHAGDTRKSPQGRVWSAQTLREPQDVRLELHDFDTPAATTAALGRSNGSVPAGGAQTVRLPSGQKTLRLVLGRGLAAALANGQATQSVHWQGGEAFQESVQTDASTLTLVNTSGQPSPYALEVTTATPQPMTLTASTPLESRRTEAGVLHVPVDTGAKPATIRVRGTARAAATLVDREGNVQRGTDLRLNGSGTLTIDHDEGWLVAWMDGQPDPVGSGLFASAARRAASVSLPGAVAMSGTDDHWQMRLEGDALLHLRTPQPVVTRIARTSGADVEIHPVAGQLATFVPAGNSTLTVRPLGGGTLFGEAELSTTPVEEIREGLGPEVILGPGTTRLFSFQVRQAGAIGIGVRADSDIVRCHLMDRNAREISSGVVQMVDLEPGTYLLALEAPANGQVVRARPALAGLEPPDSGPPSEVVRQYLELAGRTPQGVVQ